MRLDCTAPARWLVDFSTTLALQLLVLFIWASITTVHLRWRMRGTMSVLFGSIAPIGVCAVGGYLVIRRATPR